MRHDRSSTSSPTLLSQYTSTLTYHSLWKKFICYACSAVVICEQPPAGLLASADFDSGLCREMTFGFCPCSIADSVKEVGHKTNSEYRKVVEFYGQTALICPFLLGYVCLPGGNKRGGKSLPA